MIAGAELWALARKEPRHVIEPDELEERLG